MSISSRTVVYLDHEEVGNGFMDLVAIQPEDARLELFRFYLVENYVGLEALYPPHVWTSASADLWLTTNAYKSFHSKLNDACPTSHPNIEVFKNHKTKCRLRASSQGIA
ncbi:uncharacterized protein LOC117169449 [Belonocnema kinseyi]|uniref:uncharacterized protein LOC117169449 n=1 Tax=Belonocnema kinseyi TaxID=2817044 RepID=UPI00143CCC19|nr:uncharacterized protein LOC117169449 [Belonocnema kinseyi]